MGRQPYAKLLNCVWRNPKIARICDEHPRAICLWVSSISYCADQNNDGRFSLFEASRFIGAHDGEADLMADLGLWDRDGDGWMVHDYLDVQNSAEQRSGGEAKAGPLSNAERQRRYKARRRAEGQPAMSDGGDVAPVTPVTEGNETSVTVGNGGSVTGNVTGNAEGNVTGNETYVTVGNAVPVTPVTDGGVTGNADGNAAGNDQSKSKSKSKIIPLYPPSGDGDDGLERFRTVYPRHANRAKVSDAWARALRDGATPDMLIAAASEYARTCRAESRPDRYIANPANWLDDGKWRDHMPRRRPGPPRYEMPPHEHNAGCDHVRSLCAPYEGELSAANVNGPGTSPWFLFRDMVAKRLNHGDTGPDALDAALEAATS